MSDKMASYYFDILETMYTDIDESLHKFLPTEKDLAPLVIKWYEEGKSLTQAMELIQEMFIPKDENPAR